MGFFNDLVRGKGVLKYALGLFDLDENVRGHTRFVIQLTALGLALVLFHSLTTAFFPHYNPSNILNRLRGMNDFHFISTDGGFYEILGTHLNDNAKGFNLDITTVEGGSKEIANNVLGKNDAVAIIQSDVLFRAGYSEKQIRNIAPIYEEKIHVFFSRAKWEKLNGPIPFRKVKNETFVDWPMLRLEPGMDVVNFFTGANVRLQSKEMGLNLSLASSVLDICGLLPLVEQRAESFATALESLKADKLQVVFWTGGAPHEKTREFLEANHSIGMMSVHPEVRVGLDEIYSRPMKPSGFAGAQKESTVYGPRFSGVMTLSTEALLVTNPNVPFWVIRGVAESLKKFQENKDPSPLSGRDFHERIAQNYPSKNISLAQTLLFLALFIYTIGSGIAALILWLISNRKQSAYLRDITEIYAESLPMHTILEIQTSTFEVPEVEWGSKRYVNKTTKGIADLVKLIAKIREDSVTGGITVGHQQYIMSTAYEVKGILRAQLARGLARAYNEGYEFSLKELTRFYYSGYILRADFNDLRALVQSRQLKEKAATGD